VNDLVPLLEASIAREELEARVSDELDALLAAKLEKFTWR
jgi:hypothetical protein